MLVALFKALKHPAFVPPIDIETGQPTAKVTS
jgi:hypothetical protein